MKGRTNGGYIVMAAPSYFKSVNAIRHDDRYANELPRVVGELQRQPFRNPKLQTHPLRGVNRGGRKTFASYVGGPRSDRRIVWRIANRTVLALLYGPHEIYNSDPPGIACTLLHRASHGTRTADADCG